MTEKKEIPPAKEPKELLEATEILPAKDIPPEFADSLIFPQLPPVIQQAWIKKLAETKTVAEKAEKEKTDG